MNLDQRFRTARKLALALGIFLSFSAAAMLGQSGAGSIQGTIKDPTGAVMHDADIEVVNTATGVAVDTKSNHTGFYQVPGLFTGTYKLTVTAPGMKTYETSIELLVSQNAVINPQMATGAVTEKVDVNADTVQMTTNDSPAIESTLENARIQELPQNTRDITNLTTQTTPGMVINGISQPVLNGGDLGTLTYVIDGMPATNNNRGGGFQPNATLIDPDAIQEVRVETSNSSAQFASPGTAILSTKSGTNRIHGTLFETARNNAFGVDRNRDDPTTGKKPEYIRNEFGISAGGPVVIPKLYNGKDKTFWFAAYERFSLAQQSSSRTAVPTAAWRRGDFSTYTTAKGVQQNIYDPATTSGPPNYTRAQFKYQGVPNTIDPARESPLAAIGFALYPLPTTNDNPNITPNLIATTPQLQITPKETVRVDQVFNQNNRIYARYTQQANTVHTTGATPQSLAVGNIPAGAVLGFKDAPNYSYIGAVGFTHIFSPTFFSETVVGADWQNLTNVTGIASNVNYESMLNLPNNFGALGFPAIRGLIQNLAGSQSGNLHQTQRNFQLDENLTKIVGHHQVIFGGRLTRNSSTNKPASTPDVTTYTKLPTGLYDPTSKANYNILANTGSADASFFIGAASSYNVNLSAPNMSYKQWNGSLYVQDNFHFSSRLTLNLGLRYEAHPSVQTGNGLMNAFDLKNDAVVLSSPISQLIAKGYTTQAIITNDQFIGIKFEQASDAGLPDSLLKSYYWNFLPRVGFAYVLNSSPHSPILRGGYGIYLYDTPQEDFVNGQAGNNPLQTSYTMDYASAAQAVDGLPNELLRYNDPVQFGTAGVAGPGGVANNVNTSSTTAIIPGTATTFYSADPNWKPARVEQMNATLEIPLPGRSAFRLSYVGSRSTNLDVRLSYNNTPSVYQWESSRGIVPPTGGVSVLGTPLQNTYGNTATNPYDNTTYGQNSIETKQGFANFNSMQMNYQRLYHAGAAFQISYTWARGMRAGGDVGGAGSGTVYPNANFAGRNGTAGIVSLLPSQTTPFVAPAPPTPPAGLASYDTWHDMVRYQLYNRDNKVPQHFVKFNGLLDIPVGRGKHFFKNTPRWLDEVIGGYKLAGSGEVRSQAFQPGTGFFGAIAPFKVYKKSHPVSDCSSGVCYNNFLWWNGDISPQQNPNDPGHNATLTTACEKTSTCISGIPSDYVPYQVPSHNVPSDANFNSDKVNITLLNGTTTTATYDGGPGASPTAAQPTSTVQNYSTRVWLPGPFNWTANLSVFKVFPIRQGVFLRVNVDAFNVFNMPGENNPNSNTGIQSFLTNYYDARQIQLTARFTF